MVSGRGDVGERYVKEPDPQSTASDFTEQIECVRFRKDSLSAIVFGLFPRTKSRAQLKLIALHFASSRDCTSFSGHLAPWGATFTMEGNLHLKPGSLKKALAAYKQALCIAQKLSLKQSIAVALANIEIVFRHKGNERQALLHFRRTLALNESIGNQEGIARDSENIGIYHLRNKAWYQADRWFSRSLHTNSRLGNREKMIWAQQSMTQPA
ncbi:MAG: hypothetical protein JWM68_1283 [Verrucomicrobiales bacterium]|nr:hypothetical protein [Verrucomicrobiales bacterium]